MSEKIENAKIYLNGQPKTKDEFTPRGRESNQQHTLNIALDISHLDIAELMQQSRFYLQNDLQQKTEKRMQSYPGLFI